MRSSTAAVGLVENAHLEPDFRHMRVKLSLDPDMEGHLGPGTQFWIIGKTLSFAKQDR
jgi:paraquat-inducible protein B